jgi:sarcosine oxidase
MVTSEYVVIGAGLAGAATAWNLARDGHDVTLVERDQPAARDGSSHGSARIFRYAYPSAFYTGLVAESKPLWDELATLSGQELITVTGALDFGASRDPAALAAILDKAGVEHELLDRRGAGRRWPQIEFDTDVLWHPGAGVIDAETAVQAMVSLAVGHGAQLRTHWPVDKITPTATGYLVGSATGEQISTNSVVVSAGGWLPQLLDALPLPNDFRRRIPPLQVRQEQAYHFPYRTNLASPQPDWPTFIHKSPQLQTYSLPGGRDAEFRGQKLAEYNGGRIMASAADQDGLIDPANRARIVDYVTRNLPGLIPEPYAETTCLFTNTPNEDFILDRSAGITLLSPCSGHGAKFAPLIGRLAADLATGKQAAPERFRLTAQAASHV